MESWQNGRQELVDELLKVYDKIGTNVATELDEETHTIIWRDNLQSLQDKANRVDDLEDEVLTLTQQKRAQDSSANNNRLAQEKTAEHERLAEENARLMEEIEEHKGVVLRAEGLENENQCLATELQEALQRLREVKNKGSNEINPIPGPPNSLEKFEHDGSELVTSEIYRRLVGKYNDLHQNLSAVMAAREKLESMAREEKKKVRRWAEYCDGKEKIIIKKDDRIRQLEEDIQFLKGQLGHTLNVNMPASSYTKRPAGHASSGQKHSNLADVAEVTQSVSLHPLRLDGQLTEIEDSLKAMDSPILKEIITPSRTERVTGGNPLEERPPSRGIDRVSCSSARRVLVRRSEEPELELCSSEQAGLLDSSELPKLPSGSAASDMFNDTQFETIEPHYSSITEGDVDLDSPSRTGDHEISIQGTVMTRMPSSPDVPVVISARSVMNRKGRSRIVHKSPVTRIKIETISSSPIGLAGFHDMEPNESIDLDEIGDKQVTPRKQRPIQHHADRAVSREVEMEQGYRNMGLDRGHPSFEHESSGISQSAPLIRTTPTRTRFALQPRSTNKQILPRTSDERASKRRRLASDHAIEELTEDGENDGPLARRCEMIDSLKFSRRLDNLLDKPTPPKNKLTPLHRPIDRLGIPTARKTNTTQTRTYEPDPTDDFLSARYHGHSSTLSPRPSSKGTSRESLEQSRPLEGTFQGSTHSSRPTPTGFPNDPPQSSKSSLLKETTFWSTSAYTMPKKRGLPWESTTTSKPPLTIYERQPATTGEMTVSKCLPRSTEERSNAKVRPENKSLRSRPLDKLDINDFKVNPAYNQGYKYAFGEVVRNREDRRCLQGCTKPECCGNAFRAFASVLRDPNKTPTSSQEEKDDDLLEEFMGHNAYKIRNMSKAERQEMLLQAQTRQMANQVGRHRQAYERRQSPPGFWRVDFATTQEEAEDRIKKVEYRRGIVRERYMEAMRVGGKFLFRDE